MKLAIMADSHDRWDYLEKAIAIANQNQCQLLLFAGDLVSPPGIAVLSKFQGKVIFVWGNNEAERVGITRQMDASKNIILAGDVYEDNIDNTRIFMNHYPRFVELAAKSQEFDLTIHGHTHLFREEKVNDCLLVNPGEIQGFKTGKSSFIIYDTDYKSIEQINVND